MKNLKYKVYYTYDNTTLKNIFAVDGGKVFDHYNFETIYLNDKTNHFNI